MNQIAGRYDYDVIVVGGGPAGAATATHLARNGREVLLVDRAMFPRPKPCGEFFSPPVRGLLQDLGVYDKVQAYGVPAISEARLVSADGVGFGGTYTKAHHAWAKEGGFSLPRHILDNLLWQNAREAGANTRDGVSVRNLLQENGRVVGVETDRGTFRAPLVVGADGGRSRVARDLNLTRPIARLQKIGVVSHWAATNLPARVEMHVAQGGLACGIGPQANGTANVTMEVPEHLNREIAKAGHEAFLRDTLRIHFPQIAQHLTGATLLQVRTCGTFGHTTRTPVHDGAMLVGDAAAFIDPFTGEGVYFALRSAEMAAHVAEQALRRGDMSARGLVQYARWRKRELSPKYAVCDLVERAVHTPTLMRVFAPKLNRVPEVVNTLLSVTGDMQSPYRLLAPTFWARALMA